MNQPDTPLPREFYDRPTLTVARDLIGRHLIHTHEGRQRIVRIVETEAYQGPQDLAAHSARGRTERNAAMFGPPGHAYVYLIYGMWHCMNVVTRSTGIPHAVLIRGAEPIQHIDNTTHGPGLLCRALHITRALNGSDLLGNTLWLSAGSPPLRKDIASAPRIGIDYAGHWADKPWRFYLRTSAHVSTAPATQRRTPPPVHG